MPPPVAPAPRGLSASRGLAASGRPSRTRLFARRPPPAARRAAGGRVQRAERVCPRGRRNASLGLMTLTFRRDPEPTPALCDALVALWARVSNAGGAVGFVPPVTEDDVRPSLEAYLPQIEQGRVRPLVGFDGDRPVATAFLSLNTHRLMGHWGWLYTVMVDPALQGRGVGLRLLRAAEEFARDQGLRALRLTCRGGLGLERFYEAAGYKEVGRVPSAIRVAPGDERDDVMMWLPLT
nr:GNAT family N-acetyltransferase [Streptomyces sp. ICBB 8177]